MQVNNLEGKRSKQLIAKYIKIIIPMSSPKILDFLKTYLVICFHGETFREIAQRRLLNCSLRFTYQCTTASSSLEGVQLK